MITDVILSIIFGPIRYVAERLPEWTLPGWLASSGSGSMGDLAASIGTKLDGLDAWVPMAEAVDMFGWYVGLLSAVFVWKGIQFAVSLFSGGGGNT